MVFSKFFLGCKLVSPKDGGFFCVRDQLCAVAFVSHAKNGNDQNAIVNELPSSEQSLPTTWRSRVEVNKTVLSYFYITVYIASKTNNTHTRDRPILVATANRVAGCVRPFLLLS